MNGTDFYSLAVKLSAGSSPAEMRSAISRAYYGAYHRARELLETWGIILPGGPECHTKVRHLLESSNDQRLVAASLRLSTLRIARNDADYELRNARAEARKTVLIRLEAAAEAIACLDSYFSADSAAVAAHVRQYAKDVLRLVVT